MKNVAFLGLGVMGYPMAGHLAKNGFEVCVYNRTSEKAGRWAGEHNGKAASTPAEAVASADIILACLGDDPDVRAVIDDAKSARCLTAQFWSIIQPRRRVWPVTSLMN